MRKTKIVATIGPSSQDVKTLEGMVKNGLDVVRLNFSHGEFAEHENVVNTIRSIGKKHEKHIGILVDLQGPKIRIGRFKSGPILLKPGDLFTIDPNWPNNEGNKDGVSVDYERLATDVKVGDFLVLNDGLISVKVCSIEGTKVFTQCVVGGELSSSKGINVRGGGLSASALTEKDLEDLESGCRLGADYIALSFVKDAQDIIRARSLIKKHGGHAGVVAKIERKEALDHLDQIISASDGVMVARGDLALEIGDAEVPIVQKQILQRSKTFVKPVIIATQMMESMIVNKTPTRAETSDVANATLDGCDAVMLSAETAIGEHPEEVIQAVARTCQMVEQSKWWHSQTENFPIDHMINERSGVIAWSAAQMAMQQPVSGLVTITESGLTALRISRFRDWI